MAAWRQMGVWLALVAVGACDGAPPAPAAQPVGAAVAAAEPPVQAVAEPVEPAPTPEEARTLPAEQVALLDAWYQQVGTPRAKETFGELVVRAARLQLGKTYHDPKKGRRPETLRVELGTFQCVSYVESSLAMADCLWRDTPDAACFMRGVESLRYRNGEMVDYGSRLHYFADWIADNAARKNLIDLTRELGGTAERFRFDFMSSHPKLYPWLSDEATLQRIAADEARLSAAERFVVSEEAAWKAQRELQTGDIVAIVSTKYPGLLVRHAGFIDVSPEGVPRLLHASSHHERVLLTRSGIAAYLSRMPDRRGMLVARPVTPGN